MSDVHERTRRNDGLVGLLKEWGPAVLIIGGAIMTWTRLQDLIPAVKETQDRVSVLERQASVTVANFGTTTDRLERIERKIDRGFR